MPTQESASTITIILSAILFQGLMTDNVSKQDMHELWKYYAFKGTDLKYNAE